jgi:Family of unknown function (DUF5683)
MESSADNTNIDFQCYNKGLGKIVIPFSSDKDPERIAAIFDKLKDWKITVTIRKYAPLIKSILTGALFFMQLSLHARETGTFRDSVALSADWSAVNVRDSIVHKPDTSAFVIRENAFDTLGPEAPKKSVHSPQRATIFSAVVPGLGQAYNHKYWKIPVIYAGGVTIYMFYKSYNSKYLIAKEAYEDLLKNDPKNPSLDKYALDRDQFSSWRTLNIILMGILYTANVVDALADAYFYRYDISDDLTLKIQPKIMSVNNFALNGYSCGFSLSLNF